MKVALVGLGQMGAYHLRVLIESDEIECVYVYDVDASRIPNGEKVLPQKSLDEVVAREPDYAVVASPTSHHLIPALKLASRCVPTLIEKPVAMNLAEAQQIDQAFRRTSTFYAVGHVERFNPALALARQKIREGLIGDLLSIRTTRVGPFPSRIGDVGVVRDLGTHDIDLARWITGGLSYTSIFPVLGNYRGGGHEDLFSLVGKLGDKIIVSHEVNWLSPVKRRQAQFLGTKGLLVADTLLGELRFFENGKAQSEWSTYKNFRGVTEGPEFKYVVTYQEPLKLEHEAMWSKLAGKSHGYLCSGKDALGVMTVISQILGE